jgi:hypothetical protein
MDAQPVAGDAGGDHLGHDAADLGGQRAAVGVAEHDPARALPHARRAGRTAHNRGWPCSRRRNARRRTAPRGPACAGGRRSRDGLAVFVQRDAKRGGDVEVMGLADQADGRGAGIQHGGQDVVIGGTAPDALGHAKGGHGGAGLRGRRQRTRCRSGWRRASRPRCSRGPGRPAHGRSGPFSAVENCTPWVCWPSRRVVSKR